MPLPLTPTVNFNTAQTHVNGVKLLRLGNAKDACLAYATDVLGPLDGGQFYQGEATFPAFFWAQSFGNAVLWIDGTLTLEQAAGQVAGYIGAPADSWVEPLSANLRTAAAIIIARIVVDFGAFPGQVFVGGWSWGGAIAQMLPIVAEAAGFPDAVWGITTFGSPRVGGPQLGAEIRRKAEGIRWMNSNDPIPLVPPRLSEFPPIAVLFGLRGMTRSEYFLHPFGGIAMFPDGSFQSSNVPPQGIVQFGAGLAQWLLASDNDEANSHSLLAYRRNIIACLAAPQRAHGVNPPAPERAQQNAARGVSRQAAGFVHNIEVLGQQQGGEPVILPKDHIFTWQKLGGIFIVSFGDLTVTTCNTKKRARNLANAGNNFLERVQGQAVVDPGAMVEQFTNYFAAAVDAGQFKPPMNTQFPPLGN